MGNVHLRKYGVETTVDFTLFEVDGVDFRVDAAAATADTIIQIDEGAAGSCTNLFVDEGLGYSHTLTAAEVTGARIVVYIVDSATKVWLDDSYIIETYGHPSAMHAFDLDTSFGSAAIAYGGVAGSSLTAIDLPNQTMDIVGNITGNLSGSVGSVTGHTAQTGDSFARIGAAGASLTAINLPNQTMDIVGDITGNLSGSVGSITGHTAQTGDSFARIGAGGSSLTALPGQPYGIKKNTVLSDFEFLMVDATDHATPETGLTVLGYRSIDGGVFGSATGVTAEVGNGIYQFDAAAADTNGGLVTWRFSASGAADTFFTFKTET